MSAGQVRLSLQPDSAPPLVLQPCPPSAAPLPSPRLGGPTPRGRLGSQVLGLRWLARASSRLFPGQGDAQGVTQRAKLWSGVGHAAQEPPHPGPACLPSSRSMVLGTGDGGECIGSILALKFFLLKVSLGV